MEEKINDLKDAIEQTENLIEILESNKDYENNIKDLKGLLEDLKYDVEIKQEELDEQKEIENLKKKKEYEEYLDECIASFNTTRL